MLPVLGNMQLTQAISLQEHTVGHHRNILNVHALLEKAHSKQEEEEKRMKEEASAPDSSGPKSQKEGN